MTTHTIKHCVQLNQLLINYSKTDSRRKEQIDAGSRVAHHTHNNYVHSASMSEQQAYGLVHRSVAHSQTCSKSFSGPRVCGPQPDLLQVLLCGAGVVNTH